MFKNYLFIFLFSILLSSCGGGGGSNNPNYNSNSNTDNFDRSSIITHVFDDIIIPSYDDFLSSLSNLESSVSTFQNDVSSVNLESLRASFISSYKSWQYVAIYNFDYAEFQEYSSKMNSYPTDTFYIQNNINNFSTDIVNVYDAWGLPALDYMLYGDLINDNTLSFNIDSSHYFLYLDTVVARMNHLTSMVRDDLLANRQSFITSTGNTSTSSLNKMVNAFVQHYEQRFRKYKIGLPSGSCPLCVSPEPHLVEGLYAQNISKQLAVESWNAIYNFYIGQSFDGSSSSVGNLNSYLEYLSYNNLSHAIVLGLDSVGVSLNSLDDSFEHQINTDNSKMVECRAQIQSVVPKLKTQMMSQLGIQVTYADSDGD